MIFKKTLSIILFTLLVLGLALGAQTLKTKALSTGTDLNMSSLISPDGGETWIPSTEPVCVEPNQPVTIIYRVWNTGTETADTVHGTGELTNNQYAQSTMTNGDCDNDGNSFTKNPLTSSFDLFKVPSLGSEYNGEQCARVNVTPLPETPCDTPLQGTTTLTTYTNGKDDSADRLINFIGRALATSTHAEQVFPLVRVNRDDCPRPCDDHGRFKKISVTSTTQLPQTGYSIFNLIKF